MDFVVGDKVETLDDTIHGVVVTIQGDEITLKDPDGFLLTYPSTDLVKIPHRITVTPQEALRGKVEKEPPRKKRTKVPKSKKRPVPKMEVDLHIHQLVKSTKGMTNHDMLNLQLETAKRQLDFAIGKRIQRVVFIHGVGEGVLREELQYLFRRYDNLRYYDADYRTYGLGATEVYIFQNP